MRKVYRPGKVYRGKRTLIDQGLILAFSLACVMLTVQSAIDVRARWLSVDDANLQLWTSDLKTELKQQSWALAKEVFEDKTVTRIITEGFGVPGASLRSETSANSLEERHPFIGEMFVSTGVVAFAPGTPPPLAKAVQPILQRALTGNALPFDAISVFEFMRGGATYQVFYKPVRGTEANRVNGVGFISDLGWIRKDLLPKTSYTVSREHIRRGGISPDMKDLSLQDVEPNALDAGSPQVFNRFDQLFSFWNFRVSEEWIAKERSSIAKSLIPTVGFSAMVFSLIGMGIVEIRKARKERKVAQLRSAFIDQVSHQLKTPLTLISLYADTLVAQEEAPLEERRTYYEIIGRESARLSAMVDRVLEFYRVERGERKYRLEPGDLNTMIRHIMDEYTPLLRRSGFRVETRLTPGLPQVCFDMQAVSQAILNLLDNARKYSGDGRYIGVDTYGDSSRVVVEVRDNGVGMGPDEQDLIFQEFYRSHETRRERGSGLGLFLVKHIADEHGATIEVDSSVGVGSRFRLIFTAFKPNSMHTDLIVEKLS